MHLLYQTKTMAEDPLLISDTREVKIHIYV